MAIVLMTGGEGSRVALGAGNGIEIGPEEAFLRRQVLDLRLTADLTEVRFLYKE